MNGSPTNDADVTNKQYVDDAVANVGSSLSSSIKQIMSVQKSETTGDNMLVIDLTNL